MTHGDGPVIKEEVDPWASKWVAWEVHGGGWLASGTREAGPSAVGILVWGDLLELIFQLPF